MAGHVPGRTAESPHVDDDRRAVALALVATVVMAAGIIALFMFITWAAYNSS